MLGRGVYGLAEVARYTEIHPGRVRSWFTTRPYGLTRGPLFFSDYPIVDNNYGVSFLDLIDVRVAAELRESGVTMAKIRTVYGRLKKRLETTHPFAHNRFYTDGQEIIIQEAGALEDDPLVDVLSKQQLYAQSREFLKHIEYDADTELASLWTISNGVVIDPGLSFGKPVIKGTGTTTFVVSNSFVANNEDTGLVGDLFGLSEEQVMNAVGFEERYGCPRAA